MLVASALLASAVFALASSLDHELSTLKAKLQAAEFLNIRRGPWTGAPWVGMGLAEAVNDWDSLPNATKLALATNGHAHIAIKGTQVRGKGGFFRLHPREEAAADVERFVSMAEQMGGGAAANSLNLLFKMRGNTPVWSKALIDGMRAQQSNGPINPPHYPGADEDIRTALRSFVPNQLLTQPSARIGVFSSLTPWVELILQSETKASQITTVEYNAPIIEDSNAGLSTLSVADLPSAHAKGTRFDVIVSFSGIEHDGLGRYGDPVHPYGDLAAMREMWACLPVGGLLLLGIPMCAHDQLIWPDHRIYGPHRLKLLLKGYKLLGRAWKNESLSLHGGFEGARAKAKLFELPHPADGSSRCSWKVQPVLALQRLEVYE